MQTVLQLSKIIVQKDTIIGQLIHDVEIVQFQAVKKISIWVKSLLSYIENLLKKYSFVIFKIIRKWYRIGSKMAMEWERMYNYSNHYNRFK